MAKKMVFHAPFPVVAGSNSASGIRPYKMLHAFEALGYDVHEITGYAKSRRESFNKLRERMDRGWSPDFVYSETATIPSSFTERKHFPLIFNLDREIFRFLHSRAVPSGVFYRDVYWAFPAYVQSVGKPVAWVMTKLYKREVETFNRYVNVLFVPTPAMATHIAGLNGPSVVALPPGSDPPLETTVGDSRQEGGLRILYVGGVTSHYNVDEMLRAVNMTDGVKLTLCTPKATWGEAKAAYGDLIGPSTEVVHFSGYKLHELYANADIASLAVEPKEYWSFAAPMKLYEYLGQGKPILVSSGTHAASVVSDTQSGWVVEYDAAEINGALQRLRDNPDELEAASQAARRARGDHTWEKRAEFVSQTLEQCSGAATGSGLS